MGKVFLRAARCYKINKCVLKCNLHLHSRTPGPSPNPGLTLYLTNLTLETPIRTPYQRVAID